MSRVQARESSLWRLGCDRLNLDGHVAFALLSQLQTTIPFSLFLLDTVDALNLVLCSPRILPDSSTRFFLFLSTFLLEPCPLPRRLLHLTFLPVVNLRLPLPVSDLGCSTAVVCCQRHLRVHDVA